MSVDLNVTSEEEVDLESTSIINQSSLSRMPYRVNKSVTLT
jgi:hypothetical protein